MNPWIKASRPKTLPASISPVLLGLAYSYSMKISINYTIALITLFTSILLQISSNLINDYYDAKDGIDTNERIGPERMVSSGAISAEKMKTAFCMTLLTAFLFGIYLMIQGGAVIISIGLSSIFFAWAYTGGPFPISRYALGEVAAIIFFGIIPVYGTIYLQNREISNHGLFIGLIPGFIAATLMAVNNLRDIQQDKSSGKITIATLTGKSFFKLLTIFFSISPIIITYIVFKNFIITGILTCLYMLFIKNWVNIYSYKNESSLNQSLELTGKYLFSVCLAVSIFLIINGNHS